MTEESFIDEGVKSMSVGEHRVCAREGCSESFISRSHNQKYHDDECCRLATNQKIMEKYYAKKDQRQGKIRLCSVCGETKLSRYNDSLICAACEKREVTNARNSVIAMLSHIEMAQ